jgi:hypothetical protein
LSEYQGKTPLYQSRHVANLLAHYQSQIKKQVVWYCLSSVLAIVTLPVTMGMQAVI